MDSPAPVKADPPHPIHAIPPGPHGMTPVRSCWNCREERSFQGTPVCLVHLAVVGRLQTCDGWGGQWPIQDQKGTTMMLFHDSIPSDAERALMESRVKLTGGVPPAAAKPYGRRLSPRDASRGNLIYET